MKIIYALVAAFVATALVAKANCYWLRFLIGNSPADLYEVFVYTLMRPSIFVFLSVMGATLFGFAIKADGGNSGYKFGLAFCLVCLILTLVLNVVFLPRVRF